MLLPAVYLLVCAFLLYECFMIYVFYACFTVRICTILACVLFLLDEVGELMSHQVDTYWHLKLENMSSMV